MKNDMSRRYHIRVITNILYSGVVSCLVIVFLVTNLTMLGEYAAESGKEGSLLSIFYQPDTVIILLYVLIGILVFAMAFLLLQGRSMSYIAKISAAMRNISDGDLNTTVEVVGDDEFADMAANLNRMVEEIRELIRRENPNGRKMS